MPHPTPRPLCVYPGCPKSTYSLTGKYAGYCEGHRRQLWSGRPLRPLRRERPTGLSLQAIATYIETHQVKKHLGGCWEFLGPLNTNGYGQIGVRGKFTLVHRLMLEASGVALDPDQPVCHHCDNPRCCRPDHLYTAPQAENIKDAILRGRKKRKLTFKQAEEIRQRYAAGGITQRQLATESNVSHSLIATILTGKRYRY